jgi:peptidyl-prolyl cis-trans isomerase A (cyclophilin A)
VREVRAIKAKPLSGLTVWLRTDQRRRPPRGAAPVAVLACVAFLLLAGCTSPPPASNNNTTAPPPGTTPPPNGGQTGGTCTNNGVTTGTAPPSDAPKQGTVRVAMQTSKGNITLKLYGDDAPVTVANFVGLARAGYFDCQRFHRVIKDFMDQGGDPLSKDPAQAARWGPGGPGYNIKDEFACNDGTISEALPADCAQHDGLKYDFDEATGLLAMANTGRPHTGGSQFFLTASKPNWLDGRHTIFGEVEQGMDVVTAINTAPTATGDRPNPEILLIKVTVVG